jgi:ribosome-binding protein aMBF1 (putative translation factor)
MLKNMGYGKTKPITGVQQYIYALYNIIYNEEMMMGCKICGSLAINHHKHGRDGSGEDLCDVCYWRDKYEQIKKILDYHVATKQILVLKNEILNTPYGLERTICSNGRGKSSENNQEK